MSHHDRPLPDSLTRLLDGAVSGSSRESQSGSAADRPGRRSAHAALEATLLRGFVYGVSGLVWMLVIGLVVHHLAR